MRIITLLIAWQEDGSRFIQQFKARKGMVYFIEAILVNIAGSSATQDIFIQDRWNELGGISVDTDAIASFSAGSTGSQFVDHINHKCKFITITLRTNSSINGQVYIYGELVKASKIDLIWEWFRSGR